jgi:hypothetical protein
MRGNERQGGRTDTGLTQGQPTTPPWGRSARDPQQGTLPYGWALREPTQESGIGLVSRLWREQPFVGDFVDSFRGHQAWQGCE